MGDDKGSEVHPMWGRQQAGQQKRANTANTAVSPRAASAKVCTQTTPATFNESYTCVMCVRFKPAHCSSCLQASMLVMSPRSTELLTLTFGDSDLLM